MPTRFCEVEWCDGFHYRKRLCRTHFAAKFRPPKPRASRTTSAIIVYAWFAPDGTPEYVGRGVAKRPQAHRRTHWWTPGHILLSMTCEIEWQAMAKEGEWIGRYEPRQNIEGFRTVGPPEVRPEVPF